MSISSLSKYCIRSFFLLLLCLLAACSGDPLQDDLTQDQANQIVSLLNSNGIIATKERESGGRGKYSVTVRRGYQAQSLELLQKKGLPGRAEQSLQDLLAPQGLIPNSRDIEAVRIDRAIAVQLEEHLRKHPSIATASVVLRLKSLSESQTPAVSVVVEQREHSPITSEEVLQLVMRAVPEVHRENISISVGDSPEASTFTQLEGLTNEKGKVKGVPLVPFFLFWKVPDDDFNTLALVIIGCILAVSVSAALLGYWYGNSVHSSQSFESGLADLPVKSLKLDRPRKDLPGGQ